jgi:hypothetical protein
MVERGRLEAERYFLGWTHCLKVHGIDQDPRQQPQVRPVMS